MYSPGPDFSFRLFCTPHHWHISLETTTHLTGLFGWAGRPVLGWSWRSPGRCRAGWELLAVLGWAESICGAGALSFVPELSSRAWAAPAQGNLAYCFSECPCSSPELLLLSLKTALRTMYILFPGVMMPVNPSDSRINKIRKCFCSALQWCFPSSTGDGAMPQPLHPFLYPGSEILVMLTNKSTLYIPCYWWVIFFLFWMENQELFMPAMI